MHHLGFVSMLPAAVVMLLVAIQPALCRAQEVETCVITDTDCPCAITQSLGTCMRHLGDNMCLMGDCNDGYKCDCLAFEHCKIAKCPKYTTVENVIPSAENPFKCHLTPDAGTCTTFDRFIDTIRASDYAMQESSLTVNTTNEEVIIALQNLMEVQAEKVKVDAVLTELDVYANNVTEEERAVVEKEAKIVVTAISAAEKETAALQGVMAEAYDVDKKAAYNRRVAYTKEDTAIAREIEHDAEAAKPENQGECPRCVALKAEIEQLRKDRRAAVVETGKWVIKARDAKNKATEHGKNVEKIKQNAAEASARTIAEAEKILSRVRSLNTPNAWGKYKL